MSLKQNQPTGTIRFLRNSSIKTNGSTQTYCAARISKQTLAKALSSNPQKVIWYKEIMKFEKGEAVCWKWMGGLIQGTVEEVFLEPVTKLIKGKSIKRNGSPEKPAYLVRSEASNIALKLETELMPVSPHSKLLAKLK